MFQTASQALIDLNALKANYAILRGRAKNSEVAGVVKANGYGLGSTKIGQSLFEAGCRTFFTAHFSEALRLRAELTDCHIAVLHGLHKMEFAEAVAHKIIPVVQSYAALLEWTDFCRARGEKLPTIIQLDTGMNRLGLGVNEQDLLVARPELLEPVELKYWLSHFCSAEEATNPFNVEQAKRFAGLLAKLPPAKASLCNSSGIFLDQKLHYDLVRPGVALYGANPTPDAPNPMQPVLTLQSPILQVRTVRRGDTVGYNQTYRFEKEGKVATIALGYADGYSRALNNKGIARINDFDAPIIGRISMDLITLDVTDIPDTVAHTGAMAVMIGSHRTIDQVASEAQTIAYEILTSLGTRLERIYINEPQ